MTKPKPFHMTNPGIYRCRDGSLQVMKRAYWTNDDSVDPWRVIQGRRTDLLYYRDGQLTNRGFIDNATDLEIVALVLAVDEDGNEVRP